MELNMFDVLILFFSYFQTNRLQNVTKTSTTCIMTLELLNEKNQLVSHNKIGEIKFWQINGYDLVLHYTLSTNIIGFCKLTLYKTNMLLCKGEQSLMNCYSVNTYDMITVFDPQQKDCLGDLMVIKPIGDYVFCGYEANTIIAWKEYRPVSQYNFSELDCLMTLDVDHAVAKGICAGSSNVINTFCISEEGQLNLNKSVKITNPGISVVLLRPDNKIVAAACWDFSVRLFSWKSMKLLAVLDCHSTGVLHITYSESSVTYWKAKYMLAVANKDNKVTLWDVYSEKDT